MAIKRATQAYKKEMRITLADLSHQLETSQTDPLYQIVTEELTRRGGLRKSIRTNRAVSAAYLAVFIIIILVVLVGELAK